MFIKGQTVVDMAQPLFRLLDTSDRICQDVSSGNYTICYFPTLGVVARTHLEPRLRKTYKVLAVFDPNTTKLRTWIDDFGDMCFLDDLDRWLVEPEASTVDYEKVFWDKVECSNHKNRAFMFKHYCLVDNLMIGVLVTGKPMVLELSP